jgi:hypothetical protein
MPKQNIIKQCPECGNNFEAARLNQKYCDPDCKTQHNNRNTMEKYHERNQEDLVTREVNKMLYKNRQILKRYAGQEVELKTIEAEGFTNRYVTSFRQGEDKKMVFLCYDIAYKFLSDTTLKIEQ